MRRRKRKPVHPFHKALLKMGNSLLEGLFPIGVVVLLVLAVPFAIPIFYITELINRYRRFCPLHHERFCYEFVYLSLEEINTRLHREAEQQAAFRQAMEEGRRINFRRPGDSLNFWTKRRCFPYSCTEPLNYKEAGTYRQRYCVSCRNAEAEWKIEAQPRYERKPDETDINDY